MENLELTLNGDQKELIIRTGDAEEIVHHKGIKITGTLSAPFQFFEGKKANLKAEDCHIQIKNDTGVISLFVNDTDPHTETVIVGYLKKDVALESWRINTEKRWTIQEFLKQVKTQTFYFSDRSERNALVDSLQKFNASVTTTIQQHNDNTGNSLALLEKKINGIELKNKFSLTIPIYQGYAKQKFTVEIGLDPKSNSVDLFLISDDLFTLEIENREALVEVEIANFKDFNCSKVFLS